MKIFILFQRLHFSYLTSKTIVGYIWNSGKKRDNLFGAACSVKIMKHQTKNHLCTYGLISHDFCIIEVEGHLTLKFTDMLPIWGMIIISASSLQVPIWYQTNYLSSNTSSMGTCIGTCAEECIYVSKRGQRQRSLRRRTIRHMHMQGIWFHFLWTDPAPPPWAYWPESSWTLEKAGVKGAELGRKLKYREIYVG